MSGQAEVEPVLAQIDAATIGMLDGDCSLWKELMSHRDDVTLFGAYGGYVSGWEDVSARFDRTAAGYGRGQGGQTSRETMATWLGADLAVITGLERHEWRQVGKPDMTSFVYRFTHVLRRENGGWKIVLRHADPLATFRGPEFAHRG